MSVSQPRLDELWDFDDAAASEQRLRAAAAADTDAAEIAELRTQVARALGLQQRFEEGDAILDDVSSGPGADEAVVRVRVALERGRLRHSADDPLGAVPLFAEAEAGAADAELLFLRVDALHMLAIADRERSDQWAERALAILDEAEAAGGADDRVLRWRVGLHNNRGWARFDVDRFEDALAEFEASRTAAVRWGTAQQVQWADEAIAETRAAIDAAAS